MKKTYKRIFIELDRGNKTEGKRKKPKKRFLYRTYMILILLLLTAVVSAVCLTVLYADVVLRTEKLIAEGKLKDSVIEKIVGSNE